ncbi:MAG TPA: maleylpyruvate isomerase family mycothiol-dependent enzyme [Actinocatenispora sp.]
MYWTYERHLDAVAEAAAAYVATVADADPTTPVPTCPQWTLADLSRHHGTTYRWIDHLVRTGAQARIWSRDVPLELPDDPAELPAWVAAGAERVLATLRATDPDTPLWTWGAGRTARFWPRRALFEAVVHRADADIALGRTPRIAADVAADGIEEFLLNLPHAAWIAPRLAGAGRDGDSILLRPNGSDSGWRIACTDGWFEWDRGDAGTVEVTGSPGDLLLLTYGRIAADDPRLTVTGTASVLDGWLRVLTF